MLIAGDNYDAEMASMKGFEPKGAECGRLLQIIKKKELDAEAKAENSLERGKHIMNGYWKAIAVHMRKIYREFRDGD
jgi:hypothetical protein